MTNPDLQCIRLQAQDVPDDRMTRRVHILPCFGGDEGVGNFCELRLLDTGECSQLLHGHITVRVRARSWQQPS